MSTQSNGTAAPGPRSRIQVQGSAASPSEAAAAVAAIQQFIAGTAPQEATQTRVNPWQRASLIEGTSAKDAFASPWGEPRTWGSKHSHRPRS